MRAKIRITVCVILAVTLVACTDVPTISGYSPLSRQRELSSVNHWKIVADDVVDQLYPKAVPKADGTPAPLITDLPCVDVRRGDAENESKFQSFLADAIVTDIVERTPHIARVMSDDKSSCDGKSTRAVVGIDSIVVIKHQSKRDRPYPGKYTLLAAGLVVVRHVVRHFSEGLAVGAVAAGEVAYWASSGLRMSHTGMEVAITVSNISATGEYLSRVTNTYYIDDGESALYEPAPSPSVVTMAGPPGPPGPPGPVNRLISSQKPGECSLPELPQCTVTPSNTPPPTPKIASLQIYPKELSACENHADLIVIGVHLATNGNKYQLGQVAADPLTQLPTLYGAPANGLQSVRLKFVGLRLANQSAFPLSLTMDGPDGIATGEVSIQGTCTPPGTTPKKKVAQIPTAATLQIYPKQISACDTHADLTVIGQHLATAGSDYQLDQIAANTLGQPPSAYGASDWQRVRLRFDNLTFGNEHVSVVSLTMNGPDGIGTGQVAVVGTCGGRAPAAATVVAPAVPVAAAVPKASAATPTSPTQ
jgi:hypothetical protein